MYCMHFCTGVHMPRVYHTLFCILHAWWTRLGARLGLGHVLVHCWNSINIIQSVQLRRGLEGRADKWGWGEGSTREDEEKRGVVGRIAGVMERTGGGGG